MSFLVWLVLGYVIPWSAVLGRSERPVVALANGTWFIWVVASQSVAVSAATLEVVFVDAAVPAILAVFSWSVGVFLYAASAIIVSLRIMLYELDPKDFDPPYWVSMGAVAITVVAGARIVEMDSAPMVDATRGLIAGLSVVFWAFATWLIPVLVAAVWRHFVRNVPLVYVPTLWSMIFPLGMYAVAGIYLGRADRLPIVEAMGRAGCGWRSLRGSSSSSPWSAASAERSSPAHEEQGGGSRAADTARARGCRGDVVQPGTAEVERAAGDLVDLDGDDDGLRARHPGRIGSCSMMYLSWPSRILARP